MIEPTMISMDNHNWGARHLYVPSHSISFDAQVDRGIKLFSSGCSVRVHRHGVGSGCYSIEGVERGCVDIGLTPDVDGPTLIPVSKAPSPDSLSPESQSDN